MSALLLSLTVQAQVSVSASIKPLQAIAAAITDGANTPNVLMGSGASPHHYSLRPSERRLISNSDVVLWIGPMLEPHLESLDSQTRGLWLQALNLDDMNLLIQGDAIDQHLWLDAGNAIVIAEHLTNILLELDQENSARYQSNFQQFQQSLAQVDEQISQSFAQENLPGFAVYHNAFAYFEDRYGLKHQVSVIEQEDISPGIRHLLEVRKKIEEHNLHCVLVDPEVNVEELKTMLGNDELNYTMIDVLGWDIEISPTAYAEFLTGIAAAIHDCLR